MNLIKLKLSALQREVDKEQQLKIKEALRFGFEPPRAKESVKEITTYLYADYTNIIALQPNTLEKEGTQVIFKDPIVMFSQDEEGEIVEDPVYSVYALHTPEEIIEKIKEAELSPLRR